MTRFTRIALTGAILLAGAGAALAQPAQDDARSEPLVINGCPIWPYTRCPGADLRHASLAGKNLAGADLRGANLTGAKMVNVDLDAALLEGATWTDGRRCRAASWARAASARRRTTGTTRGRPRMSAFAKR